MNARNEFRADLFPSGACVAPDALQVAPGDETITTTEQLFSKIDHGQADERMLVIAQEACKTCVQFTKGFCVGKQAEEVAEELWRRGVGLTIISNSAVRLESLRRPASHERPTFAWDLTTIPEHTDDALAILRQGLRAKQFTTRGPTPEGVQVVGDTHLTLLKEADPSLYQKVVELGDTEVAQSLKYIVTAIFQQKDFASFSQGQRKMSRQGNPRYDPKLWRTEVDGAIVTRFLEDVVDIRELGYKKAASKAAYFEPDYFKTLAEQHKKQATSWSEFETAIDYNKINPAAALARHYAISDRIQAHNPDMPRAYVKTAARLSAKAQYEQNTTDVDTPTDLASYITPGILRAITNGASDPKKALEDFTGRVAAGQEKYGDNHSVLRLNELVAIARTYRTPDSYMKALSQYEDNFTEIKQQLGDRPGMTDAYVRRFSTAAHVKAAVTAAEKYLASREILLSQSDGTVPPSMINKCAARGMTVFTEVKAEQRRKVLISRFNQRSGHAIPPAIIERLVCLYPDPEIDDVAENIYSLLNSQLLRQAKAETFDLSGETPDDLDKIFSPKTSEYLTFAACLKGLTPVQRLAFAHYHNLMPILYGRPANSFKLEQVALRNKPLADYYEAEILPQLNPAAAKNGQPCSIMELSKDLATFDEILSVSSHQRLPQGNERLSVQGIRDATLVVGNKILYLRDKDFSWDWAGQTPDFEDWLQSAISAAYPPEQQAQAWEYAQEAVTNGVVELLGTSPGEYRLVFSRAFYEQSISGLERAVIANAMGIDRLLYHSDLTTTLKHRLGDEQINVHIQRASRPEVTEFAEEDLAQTRQILELEALNIGAQAPLHQLVLTVFGNTYDLDKLSDAKWQKIGDDLLEAYNRHIENPNHQHEVEDGLVKAQVALAWTAARGGDIQAMARLFSLASEDLYEYIEAGQAYIREQFRTIPRSRLVATQHILDNIARKESANDGPTNNKIPVTGKKPAVIKLADRQPSIEPEDIPHTATPETISRQSTVEIKTQATGLDAMQTVSGATGEFEDGDIILISRQTTEVGFGETPFEQYCKEISRYPLLTREQEVAYAKAIEVGVLAQEKLDMGHFTEQNLPDYQQLVKQGAEAKKIFINSNLRLVVAEAKNHRTNSSLAILDYVQEGNIGMIHAIEKFDYKKGYKFSTYASSWIKQYITRAQNKYSRTIYVPNNPSNQVRYYKAYCFRFIEENGRTPTDEEVMAEFDWDEKTLVTVKDITSQTPISFSAPIRSSNGDEGEFANLIEDGDIPAPGAILTQNDTINALANALQNSLVNQGKVQYAQLLTLRHGLRFRSDIIGNRLIRKHNLVEGHVYTLEEIGAMFDVTPAGVRGQLLRARELLKKPGVQKQIYYLLGNADSPY